MGLFDEKKTRVKKSRGMVPLITFFVIYVEIIQVFCAQVVRSNGGPALPLSTE
jgi:hypothetical protein